MVELPSSFHKLNKLKSLSIRHCINLETLPNGINLKSLDILDLTSCSRLRSFPDISTNISELFLSETGIEEVPWWIENFSSLSLISMWECRNLKHATLNISKLKHLEEVDFSGRWALTEARLTDSPTVEAMSKDNYLPNILLKFINCFNLNQEALVEQQTVLQELVFSGEEVPSYFTHQATGSSSSMTIPLSHCFLLHPLFRFRVCTVVGFDSMPTSDFNGVYIHVSCRFKGRFGNIFESFGQPHSFLTNQKDSHIYNGLPFSPKQRQCLLRSGGYTTSCK